MLTMASTARPNHSRATSRKKDGPRQPYKPLENMKIYLHFKSSRPHTQFVQDLTSLGAVVEPFFGKEITCVITDKQDHKTNGTPQQPNSVDSSGQSTSPSFSPGYSLGAPSTSASHPGDPRSILRTARGQALVQKAIRNGPGTSDVLELCRQWKIRVLYLKEFLPWLQHARLKARLKSVKSGKENTSKPKAKPDAPPQKLVAPFIKVEDVECAFKPLYKNMKRWPDATTDHHQVKAARRAKAPVKKPSTLLHPKEAATAPHLEGEFATPHLKEAADASHPRGGAATTPCLKGETANAVHLRGEATTAPLLQGEAATTFHQKGETANAPHLRKSEAVSATRLKEEPTTVSHRKDKAATSSRQNEPPTASHLTGVPLRLDTAKATTRVKITEQKKLNCEICNCSYTSLQKHMETKTHRSFMANPKNYFSLKKLIATIPCDLLVHATHPLSEINDQDWLTPSMLGIGNRESRLPTTFESRQPRPRSPQVMLSVKKERSDVVMQSAFKGTLSAVRHLKVVRKEPGMERCETVSEMSKTSSQKKRNATFSELDAERRKRVLSSVRHGDLFSNCDDYVPPSFSSDNNRSDGSLLPGVYKPTERAPPKSAGNLSHCVSATTDRAASDISTLEYSWTDAASGFVPDFAASKMQCSEGSDADSEDGSLSHFASYPNTDSCEVRNETNTLRKSNSKLVCLESAANATAQDSKTSSWF